jgi:hypothetical protein
MSSPLKVIRPGTPVKVGAGVDGTVTAVFLRHSEYVEYEVVWWIGGIRYEAVVPEYEVCVEKDFKPIRIGFVGDKDA